MKLYHAPVLRVVMLIDSVYTGHTDSQNVTEDFDWSIFDDEEGGFFK